MYAAHLHDDDMQRTRLAFAAATRHSRLVRRLRIAVPVVVIVALAAIILVSVFNPWRALLNLPIKAGPVVVSGTKITMEAPRLAGFTPDRRAYDISAKAAAQDLSKPGFVELSELRAKIDMQDKSQVQMTATSGIFDTKNEILTLDESIDLTSTGGYESHLSTARIDIRKGSITSDKPVAVKFLNGDLKANRLDITENGALATFGGGVSMNVVLGTPGKSDATQATPLPASSVANQALPFAPAPSTTGAPQLTIEQLLTKP